MKSSVFPIKDPVTETVTTYVSRNDAMKITGLSRGALQKYEIRDPEVLAHVKEMRNKAGAPLEMVFKLSEMQAVRQRALGSVTLDEPTPPVQLPRPHTQTRETDVASRGARRLEEARASLDDTQQLHAEMLDDLNARTKRVRGQIELLEAELVELDKDRRRVMRMAGHTADAEESLGEHPS